MTLKTRDNFEGLRGPDIRFDLLEHCLMASRMCDSISARPGGGWNVPHNGGLAVPQNRVGPLPDKFGLHVTVDRDHRPSVTIVESLDGQETVLVSQVIPRMSSHEGNRYG